MVRVDSQQYHLWKLILDTALEQIKKGMCRLVITVYPHILHELQQLESRWDSPLKDDNVIVKLTDILPNHTREKLLNFHLNNLQLESDRQHQVVKQILQNNASGPVFPWCCAYMVKHWSSSEDPTAIFSTPAKAYAQLFNDMIHDNTRGTIFAAVLALTMKGVSHFLHNLSEAAPHLKELGFPKIDDDTLAAYEDALHGSILSEGTFSSRVLYEAAGLALGRYFRLPTMLRICDLPFLVQYVHTTVVNMPGDLPSKVYVTVGSVPRRSTDSKLRSDDCQSLVERIYTEITEGNLLHVSQHPSLQCPEFLQELANYCTVDSKRIKQLLNAVDPVHRLPLVYWSAFHPSPHLTRWCLSKVQANRNLSTRFLMACSLSDHLAQSSECRLQSFLHTVSNPEHFQHPECVMNFPLLAEGQCLARDVEKQMNIIRGTGSAEHRLQYLCDPSMHVPPDVVTVQVTPDNVQLQVKDRNHWYLVFRLLTDRQVSDTDQDGNSLLHIALGSGQSLAVRLALQAGAVITQRNRRGVTPYQLACKTRSLVSKKNYMSVDQVFESMRDLGKIEVQLLLLQGVISVNDKDRVGRTGLLVACSGGCCDIADLYIELGADVSVCVQPRGFFTTGTITFMNECCTPLHYACKNGMVHTVELLIEHQADVTSTRKEATALHFACLCSSHTASADITCLLLQAGADVNAVDRNGNTPLFYAVSNDHTDAADLLIRHGADVKARNERGETPLGIAVKRCDADTADLLLRHGADVNTQTESGDTLLMFAARRGLSDTAEVLIRHGADIKAGNEWGDTPLHCALLENQPGMADCLIRHGADVNCENSYGETPLLYAVMWCDTDTFQHMIRHGAEVNSETKNGDTPLMFAARRGLSDTAEVLIRHGADINKRNKRGNTPLHSALLENHPDTADCLIRHGADVICKNKEGETPLLYAVKRCNAVTAEHLILHGADVNTERVRGDTLLMFTAREDLSDTAEVLIRHGADIKAGNEWGDTPLHCALLENHPGMADCLIRHGADLNCKNKQGETPLVYAVISCNADTVGQLIRHGADVNTETESGDTPLMCAVRRGLSDTAEVLIRHGADINKRNPWGSTPLHCALRMNHPDVADCLIRHGADVNCKNKQGETPLLCAVKRCDADTVEQLIHHGADVKTQTEWGNPLLMYAASEDNAEVLRRHGADIKVEMK
ncbi:uncharacterized protein LOC143275371 [Babylonia areolata]|uniref:uncharacterized protein LOC143275371 n=1 Tax=Babylonia areolata TaxID=304850 RepID=UPI003FD0BEB6